MLWNHFYQDFLKTFLFFFFADKKLLQRDQEENCESCWSKYTKNYIKLEMANSVHGGKETRDDFFQTLVVNEENDEIFSRSWSHAENSITTVSIHVS